MVALIKRTQYEKYCVGPVDNDLDRDWNRIVSDFVL